jgi:hypothetical protein
LVSSGSVGCGKQVLRRAALLGATPAQVLAASRSGESLGVPLHLSNGSEKDEALVKRVYNSACAAAGQVSLL